MQEVPVGAKGASKMATKDIYLKIEIIEDYSPVEPYEHVPQNVTYRRDCMRNPGHEDATIPDNEVQARALDALVYREYLDPDYLIPKVDKLVEADINEPAYHHRIPGTVIYTKPGEILKIHVLNCDKRPHSLHMHGLEFGIDSDGAWPMGIENAEGRRSDEICPGQNWTYTFRATKDTVGVWPFHDHSRMPGRSINRGLFGGVVVLPKGMKPPKPKRYGPVLDLQKHLKKQFPRGGPIRFDREEDINWRKRLHFLEEWFQVEVVKPVDPDCDVLHVPLFFHFLQNPEVKPLFDSGDIEEFGGTAELTFNQLGDYDYFCTHHPSMQGIVHVEPVGVNLALVNILDGPQRFDPPEITVAVGGTVRWTNQTGSHHTATSTQGAAMPTHCFNGRGFIGNSPTIVGHTGQKIRWYVFNLDVGNEWHNFHPHSQRWRLGAETIDVRSLGPAESFMVETEVPPVLLLEGEIKKIQNPKYRPKRAKCFNLKSDFLFHCHVHHHMMNGMAGLVRAKQQVWLTPEMVESIEQATGLALDDGKNLCPVVDLDRCRDQACGTWEQVTGDPEVIMMHAATLPGTDKILFFGKNRPDQTRLFDYVTNTFSEPANQPADLAGETPASSNLWSAEHAFLNTPEGTLLVHGGLTAGAVKSYLFDPVNELWSATGPSNDARFYSSSLTLPDGRVATLYGSNSDSLEIYDPVAGTWGVPKALPWNDYHYYPWTFLLPGGDLFIAGPQQMTRRFDWQPNLISAASLERPTNAGDRASFNGSQQGTGLLLTLRPSGYEAKVLIAGGIGTTGDKSETINLADANPQWQYEADLNESRVGCTSILLPNGKVFLAGGMTSGTAPIGGPGEIFDPQNPDKGWKACPGTNFHRLYHSSMVLLGDGSVLLGGDDNGVDPCERYYPEYFQWPRPEITDAPPSVGYAVPFIAESPQASQIVEAVLVRPGAVTHSFDMSQRSIECVINSIAGNDIEVQSPPDATVAPPGFYLLFLLDGDRVPSPGRWIRLTP